MKKILSLALGLGLLAASAVASDFEGVVDMKMSGPKGEPHNVQYSIKGAKLRLDMQGPKDHKMVMIIDNDAKKSYTLMVEQKMVMSMDLKKLEAKAAEHTGKHSLTKTGKTEQILGYTAEQYIFKGEDAVGEMEIWAAKGIGSFSMMGGGGMSAQHAPSAWEKEFRDKGYFPLRIKGKKSEMEVTKIEKKSLDASLFEVPSDYKKMDMGDMMGGMMGGAGHGGEGMKSVDPEMIKNMMKKYKHDAE